MDGLTNGYQADRVFDTLNKVDISEHIEKKNGLSYLSWAWAWAEVKKIYPDATYSIIKNAEGLPYFYDQHTGYIVYTLVTIKGLTNEMWLPVMDGANKAMKSERYVYKVKDWRSGQLVEKTVEAATMFDINKTIMRCLVKNLAMFGLGLYIYAGEDLPEQSDYTKKNFAEDAETRRIAEAELRAKVIGYCNRHEFTTEQRTKICASYKIKNMMEMSAAQCEHYINFVKSKGGNIDE